MAAAVSKLMRNQDLVIAAGKCRVSDALSQHDRASGHAGGALAAESPDRQRGRDCRLDPRRLLYGAGDAVIGINPVSDSLPVLIELLRLVDDIIFRFEVPTQSCVLTHVTNTIQAIEHGAPVDLVFQSIAGTEKANAGFGIDLALLAEARAAAQSLARGPVGDNVMYFETGQGSALSADANFGVDQQTCEARAYAVARAFSPLLINTVVGFIGPEYLYDGSRSSARAWRIISAASCSACPLGCDICYTNHAEADQDDMDTLLTLLGCAGVTYIMGVPGADDVMLNYQSTSFHDALYLRTLLGLKRAPEFERWLQRMNITDGQGRLQPIGLSHPLFAQQLPRLRA